MRDRRLWNGVPLLHRAPARYVALVLVAPAAALAGLVGLAAGPWAGLAAFPAGLVLAWVAQYFLFQ